MSASFGLGLAYITDFEASTTEKVEAIAAFAKLGYFTPFHEVIDGLVFRFDGEEMHEVSSSALGVAIAAFHKEHEFGGSFSYDAWSCVPASIIPWKTTQRFEDEFALKSSQVSFNGYDKHILMCCNDVIGLATDYLGNNDYSEQMTSLLEYLEPVEAFCEEHGVNLVVGIC